MSFMCWSLACSHALGRLHVLYGPTFSKEWHGFVLHCWSILLSFAGQTRSEGGFKPNKVSAVSVLDYGSQEKDGKTYYTYELLSRTGVTSLSPETLRPIKFDLRKPRTATVCLNTLFQELSQL